MTTIESLRQLRVFDYAVFDLGISFAGAAIASPLLSHLCAKLGWHVPKRSWVIWTLPIALFAHVISGTDTLMTQQLLDPSGHYLLKLLFILLFFAGFLGIHRHPPTKTHSR